MINYKSSLMMGSSVSMALCLSLLEKNFVRSIIGLIGRGITSGFGHCCKSDHVMNSFLMVLYSWLKEAGR